jgi:hypothetical protein
LPRLSRYLLSGLYRCPLFFLLSFLRLKTISGSMSMTTMDELAKLDDEAFLGNTNLCRRYSRQPWPPQRKYAGRGRCRQGSYRPYQGAVWRDVNAVHAPRRYTSPGHTVPLRMDDLISCDTATGHFPTLRLRHVRNHARRRPARSRPARSRIARRLGLR